MSEWQTFLKPETLTRLEGLELRARAVVDGLLAGRHRSQRRGFSTEFAEHREYAPGDDLRYIDWKVYARSDRFYLKIHEEETNLACYVVADVSESMRYRSQPNLPSKWEAAQVLTAALAYVVLRQQDAVGLAVVDDQLRHFIPPSSSPAQWRRVVETLETLKPKGFTSLGRCLQLLAEQVHRRSIVIVVSDLFDEPDELALGLRHLRSRKHDVSVFQVVDPQELQFQFEQVTLFEGLENEPKLVVDASTVAAAYRKAFHLFVEELRRQCYELHVDFLQIRTDQPLDLALAGFLKQRGEQ